MKKVTVKDVEVSEEKDVKKINIKKTLRQSTKNVKLSIWINNSK